LRSIVYTNEGSEVDAGDDDDDDTDTENVITGTTRTFQFIFDSGNGQTSTATTRIDADDSGNSNNQSFFAETQLNGNSVTIIYHVRNRTGAPISGIVVSGNVLGGITDNEKLSVSTSGGGDVVTAKWLTPNKLDRILNPSKAGKGIRWRLGSLAAGQEATLKLTAPLLRNGAGGKLTDTFKADFPGVFGDEAVDPIVVN